MPNKSYTCPVCDYPNLQEPHIDEHGYKSFEICPCCGTQFGYDDAQRTYEDLREQWLSQGAKWHSSVTSPPPEWLPMFPELTRKYAERRKKFALTDADRETFYALHAKLEQAPLRECLLETIEGMRVASVDSRTNDCVSRYRDFLEDRDPQMPLGLQSYLRSCLLPFLESLAKDGHDAGCTKRFSIWLALVKIVLHSFGDEGTVIDAVPS